MILSPREFVEIFKKTIDPTLGCVQIYEAIQEVVLRGADIEESCKSLCQDNEFAFWHYQALVILRDRLNQGTIVNNDSVELFMELTKRYGQSDCDEFFKAIDTLARSKYSDKLLDLIDYFLTAPIHDRAWLAFATLATAILPTTKIVIPCEKIQKLLEELTPMAEMEADQLRKSQMVWVLDNLRKRIT